MDDLLACLPGLAERIMAYTQDDICRLLDGPQIPGYDGRSFNIQRDGPGRHGVGYHWNPPSGVSSLATMTSWTVLPDDYPDQMLVKANRVEVLANLAKITSLGISELLVWLEESRHPLEALAKEAV